MSEENYNSNPSQNLLNSNSIAGTDSQNIEGKEIES
jgi:hypothetical protein